MSKHRINLSLDEAAACILEDIDNASMYVSAIVRHRWRRWHVALARLLESGLEREFVAGVCRQLIDAHNVPLSQLRASMDASLTRQQTDDLMVLAAEWWLHNGALRKALIEKAG